MFNNIDNRISDNLNNMTIDEKYELLKKMEKKHFGKNEKADPEFMESIVNIALDITTLVAKCLGIVK